MTDPPTTRPQVRPATVGDLVELVRLDELAREHLRERRGGQVLLAAAVRHLPAEASLRADITDDRHLVLVGEIAGAAVGYAVAELRNTADQSLIAHLSELFVEAPFRDVGVGRSLMNQVVHWATARGATGIDAQVLPGDRSSKNFFESFGLVARAISVYRPLETPLSTSEEST